MSEKRKWVPEIMYEEYEEDSISGGLPFIQVPNDKEMPGIIFIFSSQNTGEVEPGPDGEDLPITNLDLHQYANLGYLKESMDEETYDRIRVCLGLEPLKDATVKGRAITQKIRNNL